MPGSPKFLAELREFSRVTEQTLVTSNARPNPKEFIEAWYFIQYRLLWSGPAEDPSDGSSVHHDDEPGETFRLGAIIYMKKILQGFTRWATGSELLVSKLKNSLSLILTSEVTPVSSSLLLWLLFMGGVASIKNSMDRTSFVTHLVRLRRDLGIDDWEDVRERLENVLWIGKVLDKAGKALWGEVGS